MAQNWADVDKSKRGKLIRYFFSHIDLLPVNRGEPAGKDYTFLNGQDMGNYNTNQYIIQTDMQAFRKLLFRNYRNYVDSINLNISPSVSDLELGTFWGDVLTPTEDTVGGETYIRSGVNISVGGDALDTGVAHKQFIRGLKEQSIRNPDKYVEAANNALKKIDEDALVVYKTSLNKYMGEYRYPAEEAKRMAKSDFEKYKQILINQHNDIYQSSYLKAAGDKIIKTVI